MSIDLPLESQQWPMLRLFVRQVDKGTVSPWHLLPAVARGMDSRADACQVMKISRETVGKVGELIFRLRFGVIDGILQNEEPPDYAGWEVRCQAAEVTEDQLETIWDSSSQNLSLTWHDVWHGWIEGQSDKLSPGANSLLGERFFYAVDASHHTSNWSMNRHAAVCNGVDFDDCEGHPGYNTRAPGGDGTVLGNRSTSGNTWDPNRDNTTGAAKCLKFTRPGATGATRWTDLEAIEHVLNVYRGKGDPVYPVNGTTTLLSVTSSIWRAHEKSKAADLIDEICRCQRGRGVAFWDWADVPTTGNDPAELQHRLQINPQSKDDITITAPTGGSTICQGATHAGTAVAVDLQGDQRNITAHFLLGDRHDNRFGYVESVSEKIQSLGTFSVGAGGTSDRRWNDTDQSAFLALADDKRRSCSWEHIYHLFGLNAAWDGSGDDGSGVGSSRSRIDFRCGDDGHILLPSGASDTSPLLVRFLTTMPLYEGWDYSGATPVRKSGQPEIAQPVRRQPMLLIRDQPGHFYDARIDLQLSLSMTGDTFTVSSPSDDGGRVIGDPDQASLGSSYKWDRIVLVAAVELPHRIRYATGDRTATRKLRIEHEGLHLWLASDNTIYDYVGDVPNSDGTYDVLRGPCYGQPGVLRDDRAQLAALHALAASWYGPDAPVRRVARWSLKCCGLLPSFTIVSDLLGTSTVSYPKIGDFVTTITAGGKVWEINTPITSVTYDNVAGITTWSTDWGELDFAEVR